MSFHGGMLPRGRRGVNQLVFVRGLDCGEAQDIDRHLASKQAVSQYFAGGALWLHQSGTHDSRLQPQGIA